ncbi:MAG: replication-associated recombination protein A [Gammaproteobacteria bacterium]
MTIPSPFQPLAARMRPRHIEEFYGQAHLLSAGKPLRQAISRGILHSMILWGPPGTGKTTLARLLAQSANAHLETISAVLAGVKEIREIVARAQSRAAQQQPTILFVDEVHRFNKSQQDAFLPYVEDGTFTFIGATTENPSFELNPALLSRARVYVLKRLQEHEIIALIEAALSDPERGLGQRHLEVPLALKQSLAKYADGDARQALNALEILADFAVEKDGKEHLTESLLQEVLASGTVRRFDKKGDIFYEQISALHKAVRGTAPDAALYWFARMIDGGCDPEYIARRVVRIASEDIGNADPRALTLALDAWQTYQRLGSPEGELAIAQAVVYMACAAKSNAVYTAFNAALQDAQTSGSLEVPLHIRNAPTRLMKSLDYGKNYRYAHNEPEAYAAGENYFPEGLEGRHYYFPAPRGLEIQIGEKLEHLRKLDQQKKK